MPHATSVLLVVKVVALTVHLVLQGEVEGDVLHPLLGEGLGARLVLLLLDVLDHVGEPHRQAVVAARGVRVVRRDSVRKVRECLSGHQVEPVARLPEGHGEPNGHQHEGSPLVLGSEAGQDVGPNLKVGKKETGCLNNWSREHEEGGSPYWLKVQLYPAVASTIRTIIVKD